MTQHNNMKLVPYSVYLTFDLKNKLMEAARNGRGASQTVRDALNAFLFNKDAYSQGFHDGIRSAINIVESNNTDKICTQLRDILKKDDFAPSQTKTP